MNSNVGSMQVVEVHADGAVEPSTSPGDNGFVSLDGISFRCDPPGAGGCP